MKRPAEMCTVLNVKAVSCSCQTSKKIFTNFYKALEPDQTIKHCVSQANLNFLANNV